MMNLSKKSLTFFIFFVLAFLVFPGCDDDKKSHLNFVNNINVDHPRIVNLEKTSSREPALITEKVSIDPEHYHKVDSDLSKRFFGIDSIKSPETFVIEIRGEKTSLENQGLVLIDKGTKERDIIRDFVIKWEYNYYLDAMFNRIDRLGAPKKFEGRVATIATKYTEGYYHFLFDMLPRLRLLKKSGLAYDKIYVSGMHRPYVKEALEIAEVEEDKIISGNDHPIITADELIIPSLPSISYHPSPWVIEWLQEFYLEKDREVNPPKDLIYISRSDASRRRVTNEKELLGMLEILGFKVATFEGKSVKEQALMFQDAKVIMGPHGAAFSNIVFAQKGATLIELMNPTWCHGPFAVLAKDLGLNYGYVFGDSIHEPGVEEDKKVRDYTISIEKTWLELKKQLTLSDEVQEEVEKYLSDLNSTQPEN